MAKPKIVALAGGVGGARLADGLAHVLQPDRVTIIVNTGDDFTHLGLRISPDLDTVCYTLAGLENTEHGWGRRGETWRVLESLKKMGLPGWFEIGDTDLATHLARTFRLNIGDRLSHITADFCRKWGVEARVIPMSDDVIQTKVHTNQGELEFQEYFVHQRCDPVVTGFSFEGSENAKPAQGVIEAIDECDAVIVCPSNPWVSIDPILSLQSVQSELSKHPVLAVSPIIGGKTVKGPAAKMFSELGIEPSALAVAQHYVGFIDDLLIDTSDKGLINDINSLGIQPHVTDILMHNRSDRGRLAQELIDIIVAKY